MFKNICKQSLQALGRLALASLFLGGAGTGAQDTAQPMIRYDGAASIFNMQELAVIYPTDPSEPDGEMMGHRTAEDIGRRFGVKTAVFPDNAVPDEILRGHLILLGWSNRIFDDPRAPFPFPRTAKGFSIGEFQAGPEDDLMFIHFSPFNTQRYLVFWSRVDPEVARYSGFPLAPNDWTVYREYHPWGKGLLMDSEEWPPVPQPYSYVEDPTTLSPETGKSAHYSLHDKRIGIDDTDRAEVLAARETAFASAVRLLGDPGKDFRIDLSLYPDFKSKTDDSGVSDAVHDVPWKNQLHMNLANARSTSPHDEIQLIAYRVFGSCYQTVFCEGLPLALTLGDRTDPDELGVFAALLLQQNRFPAVRVLLDEGQLRASIKDGTGFPAIALFNLWLLDRVSREEYAVLFGGKDWKTPSLSAQLRLPVANLESEFTKFVQKRAAGAQREVALRAALADAHHASQQGDLQGKIDGLRRAREIEPRDPEIYYRLALALREGGEVDEAILAFSAVIEAENPDAPSYFLAHGHLQLADLLGERGEYDQARAHYEAARSFPDIQGSRELAEEALRDLDSN